MYGTVARLRLKPGSESKLAQMSRDFSADIPGFVFQLVYRMDDNPNECWLAVGFESKEAYEKNAQSPEQNKRYEQYMTMLEAPPEWHDGEIVLDDRR
jgi:hypothetical protein